MSQSQLFEPWEHENRTGKVEDEWRKGSMVEADEPSRGRKNLSRMLGVVLVLVLVLE
ncbi:MAG: hypothetical protein ACKV19_20195 [Verrucomicrobiales bacterium]